MIFGLSASTALLCASSALVCTLFAPPLRRHALTRFIMPWARGMLPTIGETEKIALKAGDVWLDGALFSGHPNWHEILKFEVKPLTDDEQAFLNGPVESLCKMLNDWEIIQQRDLPKPVWDYLKREKFFGMIIPREHGGLGFSAAAHAAVVTRIATRSIAAAVTVMVPNSLGPAELLLRYGTPAQKSHYLGRLARGEDLPCFALTEPHAGSDAAGLTSSGTVTYGQWQGEEVLGIRLNFSKRYITLAPVATVVGLAFDLKDPDHLLGEEAERGITLALLPRNLPGLRIGNRHDPMGIPFQNGPVTGTDVFIPLDAVIGGQEYVGQGWRMLMEALAAGRGISLPSLSVGAAQLSARAISAYATVREQFGLPIGKFEGVRERIARIARLAYTMHATRVLTTGGLDAGHHPSVLAAIAKGYLTEGMRTALNDAMDIQGGAGIIRGQKNIFAHPYTSIPIGITVEGANILTRSLIIFGQGVMRCHPFLQDEVEALQTKNLKMFDKAFFGHIAHALVTAVRAFTHGLTGGRLVRAPARHRRHFQHLSRLSAAFALLTELSLISLGGALKRKEYLTARFSDALAALYLATAALKRDADDARANPALAEAVQPVLQLSVHQALYDAEQALLGIIANLPNRRVASLARLLVFPQGPQHSLPTDRQTDAAAEALLNPDGLARGALTPDVYLPEAKEPGLGQLEDAYNLTVAVAPARKQLTEAIKTGKLKRGSVPDMVKDAHTVGLLTKAEHDAILKAWKARDEAVQVNASPAATYLTHR